MRPLPVAGVNPGEVGAELLGWSQTYTMDVSNGVLALGTSYASRLFSDPSEATAGLLSVSWTPQGNYGVHRSRQWRVRTHRPTRPLLLSTCVIGTMGMQPPSA